MLRPLFWTPVLLLLVSSTHAFVPTAPVAASRHRSNSLFESDSFLTRLHVFERMSEDCIASLVTAQELASQYEAAEVGTDCLLAGCLDHPTPSLRRTLQQYKLTYRACQQTLKDLYSQQQQNGNNKQEGFLVGFTSRKQKEDRPFSKPAKQVLQRAGVIAKDATTIETHHLFLSLLEYNPSTATNNKDDVKNSNPESDAWGVLEKMQGGADESPSAHDMAQTLLRHLQDNPQGDTRELVTGKSSSSKTPTLAECAVDLTQQARDQLLDPVHGREMEIRACLRTLLRRRKNNAVLLGEPGVGSKLLCVVLMMNDC